MNEQNENKRVALFAGSFDPFTMGHHRIVQRALNMFDTVVVAVGHNMGKDTMFPTEKRVADIRALYKDDNRVQVLAYSGLTVDFAKSIGAACLLRGVRSVKDFEYERDLADINLRYAETLAATLTLLEAYATHQCHKLVGSRELLDRVGQVVIRLSVV